MADRRIPVITAVAALLCCHSGTSTVTSAPIALTYSSEPDPADGIQWHLISTGHTKEPRMLSVVVVPSMKCVQDDPDVDCTYWLRVGATAEVERQAWELIRRDDVVGLRSGLACASQHCAGDWTVEIRPDAGVAAGTITVTAELQFPGDSPCGPPSDIAASVTLGAEDSEGVPWNGDSGSNDSATDTGP